MTTGFPLLERESELERLEQVVGAAREGRGRVAIVAGESGVGKTALLDATRRAAQARQMAVFDARGGEFETGFSYGLVGQLFERHLAQLGEGDRYRALGGPAAPAATALGIGDPRPGIDPFAVRHGLFWLTAHLASNTALLLSVDDAHWGDEASLHFLLHLARRLDGLAVALIVARRPGPSPAAQLAVLDTLADEPGTVAITPAPLSLSGTGQLVARTVGAGVAAEFARACHEVSGGNPFLVTELLRDLVAEGVSPDVTQAARVLQLTPPTVARSVLARLARLTPAARRLAVAVAVLGDDAQPGVAAATAELDPGAARAAAEMLEAAEVITTRGGSLSFVHPMLASAVYQDLGTSTRSATHVRAAHVLAESGAELRAAVHLLRSEPAADPWVTGRLVAAARAAAPEVAVSLLARALREPPSADERAEVLVALGEAELLCGWGEAAGHLLDARTTARAPDLRERAVRALARAQTLEGRVDEAVALLEGEIARPHVEADRAQRLAGDLAEIVIASDAHVRRLFPRLHPLLSGAPGRARRAGAAALLVHRYETAEATPAELAELAGRELDRDGLLEDVRAGSLVPVWGLYVLTRIDAFDEARSLADAGLVEAQEHGRLLTAALLAGWCGFIERRTGSLRRAQAHLETALRLVDTTEAPLVKDFLVGTTVTVLVQQGQNEAAADLLDGHDLRGRDAPEAHLLLGRAQLRLALEQYPEAARDAAAVLAVGTSRSVSTSAIGVRPVLARALKAQGDRHRAVALLQEEFEAATRFGVPSEIGAARRERALELDGPHRLAQLRQATDELAATPCRYEHAVALVELGSALRRANLRRDAREPLAEGLAQSASIGAEPLRVRAEHELEAAGIRPSRRRPASGPAALTPSELRVAELAAEGLSNDAIAARLFVTRKTVETQMGAAFRKLGVHRRHELGRALGS